MGFSLSLYKLISCIIHWIVCVLADLNFIWTLTQNNCVLSSCTKEVHIWIGLLCIIFWVIWWKNMSFWKRIAFNYFFQKIGTFGYDCHIGRCTLIGLHSADNMNLKIFYGIRYGFPTFLILVSYSILGSYVLMKRRSIKKLRYFVENIDLF